MADLFNAITPGLGYPITYGGCAVLTVNSAVVLIKEK